MEFSPKEPANRERNRPSKKNIKFKDFFAIEFGCDCSGWTDSILWTPHENLCITILQMSLPSWCMIRRILSSSGQKWKMTTIQLIIYTVFEDVFEHGCPTWHLICLICYTIFTWNLIWLFAITLWIWEDLSICWINKGDLEFRIGSYICYNIHSQIAEIPNHILVA